MPASKLLPSIAHAVSGSAGSVVSTAATYPLDLVGTRLRVQRQLLTSSAGPTPTATAAGGGSGSGSEKGDDHEEEAAPYYDGVADALRSIPAREGGLAALFAGLRTDAAKSAADSFLFFLFYSWARARRLGSGSGKRRHLGAVEELAVGAVAGACARAFTTPIANVVTRKQTASLVDDGGEQKPATARSFAEVLAEIRREKGVMGLWAGYSAALVLTLNPSITFFLQQMLTNSLVPHQDLNDPAAAVTFILAAASKAVATVATYPFQIAKTRMQIAVPDESEERSSAKGKEPIRTDDKTEGADAGLRKPAAKVVRNLAGETIFATMARIGREEGIKALYDGMSSDLLKAFLSHGITMVAKDVVHKLLFRLYYAILAYLRRHPATRAKISRAAGNVSDGLQGGVARATVARGEGVWIQSKKGAREVLDSGERVITRILGGQQKIFGR